MSDIALVVVREESIGLLVVEEEVISLEVAIAGPAGPPGMDGTSGTGVPAGGSTGQVLTKASDADDDAIWSDSSGVIAPATESTLGTVLIDGTPSDPDLPVVPVSEEVDARIAVEAAARAAAVSSEASSRASADTALSASITSEASTRATDDATLAAAIASEASTRASAITTEASARSSADTSEATARASADTTLQTNITAEASARATAVSTEATARAAADTTLQSNIDAEAASRAAADANLQPKDATLTALAALDSSTGLLEETGTDTFTKRAIGVGASSSIPTRGDADTRYAAAAHTHAESDVTGLVADLAAKQPLDATLTALAAIATGADKLAYSTGTDTFAQTDFTAVARALIAAATVSAQRIALGLVIGTDVQAYDAELAALAGLVSAADKLPYFTGSGSAALADFTSAARTFLAAASAAAQRSALGLVIGTDVQAYDPELAALAGLTSAADKLPYFTGSGTASLADLTAAARSLLDDASTSAMLTTLGAIAVSLIDAKGDLLVGTANDTIARIAVGANDTVLTADSGASGGLSYQYTARQIISTGINAWYGTQRITVTTATPSTGEMYGSPITIPKPITFIRIAIEVTTGGSAGAVARLSIYNDDGNGQPGTLVLDAGTVGTTTTGAKEVIISQSLGPGIYHLVVGSQVAGATVYRASNNPALLLMPTNTGASFAPNTITNCWKVTGVTGAMPSPFGTPVVSASAPIVGLRAP